MLWMDIIGCFLDEICGGTAMIVQKGYITYAPWIVSVSVILHPPRLLSSYQVLVGEVALGLSSFPVSID